jgi:hypothetical protein
LAPHAACDERLFDLHRGRRAGDQLRQVGADEPEDFAAQRVRAALVAAGLLLDDPLEQRDDERHARGFDRLQIDRRVKRRFAAVAFTRPGIFEHGLERRHRLACRARNIGGRIVHLANVPGRRRGLAGDIDDVAAADGDDSRQALARHLQASQQHALSGYDRIGHVLPQISAAS